jgi:PAS domain S-box-containing protein
VSTLRGDQTAAAWAQSDARFRALLQHSSDIITVMAADGTVLYNTPAVERVLGYPPEEMIGKVALDFVHPEDLPRVATRFAEAVAQPGVAVPVEFRFHHRDGRWIPLEAIGVNYLGDERVRGVIVNSRDVSERRRAEYAYRTLVDHSLQGLAIMQHGRVVFANQAVADMIGYTIEELLALDPAQLRLTAHPDDAERVAAQWRARRAGLDVPPRVEFRIVRKDGTIRWVETYASLIEYRGEPATHVAYVDITERRRADEEKTALLQIARDLTGAFDRHSVVERVLERTAALLPLDHLYVSYWDADRQVYRPLATLGPPAAFAGAADEAVISADHPIVAELGKGHTLVVNDVDRQPWLSPQLLRRFGVRALLIGPLAVRGRASGALVALRLQGSAPFGDDEAHLFDGIARQLALGLGAADRHQAEQEEAAIAAALADVGREMIASLSHPRLLERLCEITTKVLECDRSHTFLLNARERTFTAAASYGFTEEEWESLRAAQFPEALAADVLDVLRREEVVAVYAGDALFPGPLLLEVGTPGLLLMPLRRGSEIIGLHSAVMARGSSRKRFSATQLRTARGIAQLASLSIEDARLVSELERANRIKSEFVATMSHELRTPLNIIMGYNSLLLEDAFGPLSDEQRDTLARMESNARALLELINTTLDMSRLEAGQIPLDLRQVQVADVLDDVRRETLELQKGGVSFRWDAAPGVPPVRTDAAKLKVVLKNLIGNAVKFTDAGSITVGAAARDAGVEFHVADTGTGIDDASLSIIFEPFRQADGALTRRHGGVGLGLYIVRRLLNELGGSVEVESAVGKGSTFRVWIPAG